MILPTSQIKSPQFLFGMSLIRSPLHFSIRNQFTESLDTKQDLFSTTDLVEIRLLLKSTKVKTGLLILGLREYYGSVSPPHK